MSQARRAALFLGAAVAVGAGMLAGCPRRPPSPFVTIWPSAHDEGILPLAPATSGARVTLEGEALRVTLLGGDDFVVSRGDHRIPAAQEPVLRLRGRAVGIPPGVVRVWVMPKGGDLWRTTPILERLKAPRPDGAFEADVPLASALPPDGELDLVGFAVGAAGGAILVESVALVRPTPHLRWRTWLARARDPGTGEASHLLLVATLAAIGLVGAVHLVVSAAFALAGWRRPSWPPRVPARAILTVIVAVWAVMGGRAALLKLEKVWDESTGFAGLSQAERRRLGIGPQPHELTWLVDRRVPPASRLALLGRRGLGGWRIAMSLAPRPVRFLPCEATEREVPDGFVAAGPGCLETAAAVGAAGVVAGERWEAPLAGPGTVGALRAVALDVDMDTFDVAEALTVTVQDGSGRTLREAVLERHMSMVAHVPGDGSVPAAVVRLEVSRRGKADGRIAVRGVTASFLPAGVRTLAADELGNVVAWKGTGAPPVAAASLLPAEELHAGVWEVPGVVLGLLLLLGAGEASLRLLFWGGTGPAGASRLALAWLLGAGVFTLLVYVATFVGLPPWGGAAGAACVLVVAGLRMGRVPPPLPSVRRRLALDERCLAAASMVAILVVALGAATSPINEWDELINWGYRGHVFFHTGPTRDAVREYAFMSPRHKAYPPGIPLLQAATARAAGRWDDALSKAASALYFASMAPLVAAVIGARRRMALLYAALAVTGSLALLMGTLGMADLPLGPLLLAALLCVDRYTGARGSAGWLLTAGLVGVLMSWVKLDGGALKLLVLAVAGVKVAALGAGAVRRAGHFAGMVALAFLPLLPWSHTYRSLGLTDWVVNRATLQPGYLLAKLELVDDIGGRLPHYLFHSAWAGGPNFGAAYVMLLALLVLAPGVVLGSRCRYLTLALVAGILGYATIYLVSPQGTYQMERSLDRILIHFFPLAVALAGRAHALSLGPEACRR